MTPRFASAAVLLCACAHSQPARADSASGTIAVSFTVLPACSVTAAPLVFAGPAGVRADAEAKIAVRCNGENAVAVSLDDGLGGGGGQRRLTGAGGAGVPYTLYRDAARTRPWQAAPAAAEVGPAGARLTAYGRIEAHDTRVAPGTYRDTVTVTIAF